MAWDILQSFVVFNLAEQERRGGDAQEYILLDDTSAFTKLAFFFQQDEDMLSKEHADVKPILEGKRLLLLRELLREVNFPTANELVENIAKGF